VGKATTIGLDLAKGVFQAHGADEAGAVMFRNKLRRAQVLEFFSAQPPCTVAMEACGGAHHWGREIGKLGHAVRLIPPAYVKPFVKRQKNDMADAEAICEAAQRPSMRFVAVTSEAAQAAAVVFRARDLLVRQQTQIINALRGHLAEFGLVVAQGPAHVAKLVAAIEDPEHPFPEAACPVLQILAGTLGVLEERIKLLDLEIARRAKEDELAYRLMTATPFLSAAYTCPSRQQLGNAMQMGLVAIRASLPPNGATRGAPERPLTKKRAIIPAAQACSP